MKCQVDFLLGNEEAYYLTESVFAFAASAMIPIGQAASAGNLTFRSGATIVAKEEIATAAGAGAQKYTTDLTGNQTAGMIAGMAASMATAKGLNGIEAGAKKLEKPKLGDVGDGGGSVLNDVGDGASVKSGKTTINGLEIIDGKVDGKIPLDEYQDIFGKGIHNENSDTMTLGKFRPTVNPDGSENWKIAGADSYNVIAHKNGDMYFDMKDGLYDATLANYDLSYQNMFEYFNVPALDKAASEGKTIRFTHNPELKEYSGSFTDKEWKHLQEKWGYLYLREEGGFWYAEK